MTSNAYHIFKKFKRRGNRSTLLNTGKCEAHNELNLDMIHHQDIKYIVLFPTCSVFGPVLTGSDTQC